MPSEESAASEETVQEEDAKELEPLLLAMTIVTHDFSNESEDSIERYEYDTSGNVSK